MAGTTNENQDSPIFYFIFIPHGFYHLHVLKKSSLSHLVSWCLFLVVLTLSFSSIIPQLKQFLDTEVLFHNKIKKLKKANDRILVSAFQPIHAAVQAHRTQTNLLSLASVSTCFKPQDEGGGGGEKKGRCCAYSPRTRRENDNLIMKMNIFQHVIALWTRDRMVILKVWGLILFAVWPEQGAVFLFCFVWSGTRQ